MGKKALHIQFDKIDAFIKIYGGIRYLVLSEYNEVYDKIKYLIREKNGFTDNTDHNFASIRNDSYNSLPTEKLLPFHNVIILVKSVFNEQKFNYNNIVSEKGSHKDKFNTK